MLGEHGLKKQPTNVTANLVFNLAQKNTKEHILNCIVKVEKKIASPTFGFVLKTSTPLGKPILSKFTIRLLAEKHSAGQHMVVFSQKTHVRDF